MNSSSSKRHCRINSAESVALSLLSYRPDGQQAEPRVSDLEWLVGDGDTPQKVQYLACDPFRNILARRGTGFMSQSFPDPYVLEYELYLF